MTNVLFFFTRWAVGGSLGSGPPLRDAVVSRSVKTSSYLNLDTDSLSGSGPGTVAHPQLLLLQRNNCCCVVMVAHPFQTLTWKSGSYNVVKSGYNGLIARMQCRPSDIANPQLGLNITRTLVGPLGARTKKSWWPLWVQHIPKWNTVTWSMLTYTRSAVDRSTGTGYQAVT